MHRPERKTRVSETSQGRTPHPFDAATALQAIGDGTFTGHTSDEYWNFTGPFGGATAATLLRAVMEHPRRLGVPLSITVNFCAPVAKGAFTIIVREVRSNRSTQHWFMELAQAEAGIAATATAVFAKRPATWSHTSARMPAAPAPEAIPPLPMRGMMAWLKHYQFRFAKGMPERPAATPRAEPGSALSHVWVSETEPRPLDFLSLLAFSDTFFGRIFHVRGAIQTIGTVSMTTYFHADAEDIATVGSGPLFGAADAHVFTKGYFDQTGQLWSRDGRLLATTQQIVYFRD
jgi:acyl-CoA thioesterase